jgi:hypothetical protein
MDWTSFPVSVGRRGAGWGIHPIEWIAKTQRSAMGGACFFTVPDRTSVYRMSHSCEPDGKVTVAFLAIGTAIGQMVGRAGFEPA